MGETLKRQHIQH